MSNKVCEEMVWKEKKIRKLIKRIRRQIPDNDSLSFQTRIGKISWNEVAFKSISPEECSEAWSQLSARVRKFRLLTEILDDALAYTEENVTNKPIVTRSTVAISKESKPNKEKATHISDDKEHEDDVTMQDATHISDDEEHEDDVTMQDILLAFQDGTKEKKEDKKKRTTNARNGEKRAKKPEAKSTRPKLEAVHIDSSEENACFLYMKDNKVFKKAPAATIHSWKKIWNALPESQKKPWLQKAEKQELAKRDKLLGKSRPPTVPPTVHTYFMQQYLKNNPGIEPKLKFSSGSQAWKSLDEAARDEVIKEWNLARREAYESAREYLESLDPADRECEEKHYVTAPPAKRKRAASVSLESKPAETLPKAAKRSRAKSVFTNTKVPPDEKINEFDVEKTNNRRSSKDAIRDRLKSRMRSTSEELYADIDEDYFEADEPVSPSKKLQATHKDVDLHQKASASTRSMSPELLDEEKCDAEEPTSPVLKRKKSPRKESVFRLNTSNREMTPESEDFKPKSKKSDKLRLKKNEKSVPPTHNIRVGGESQIDTTGEEEAEASYVFSTKDTTKQKSKKSKKKTLEEDSDKGSDPRRTMGETEFLNHAGVTSSPKKRLPKKPEVEEYFGNGSSSLEGGAPVIEPKAPPETAEKLYEMTSSNMKDPEPWALLPEKNKRRYRDALRALKKKYVSEYEVYLKAQPHQVLEGKANECN